MQRDAARLGAGRQGPRAGRHRPGDPGNAKLAEFVRRTGVLVLPKPFDNAGRQQLVRDAIER